MTSKPIWHVPTAKDFTAMKLAWHKRATDNLQISLGAKAFTGLLMHDFLDRERGCAYAAQETYAKRLGTNLRNIQRYTKELNENGLMKSVPRRGRKHMPDELWPVYEPIKAAKNPPKTGF